MRFPAKITSSCIWLRYLLSLLSHFTLVCLWYGRTGLRSRDYQNFSDPRMGRLPYFLRYGTMLARAWRARGALLKEFGVYYYFAMIT